MNEIGDLGFAMYYGACNTFVSNNAEFVLLCFTFTENTKACHR